MSEFMGLLVTVSSEKLVFDLFQFKYTCSLAFLFAMSMKKFSISQYIHIYYIKMYTCTSVFMYYVCYKTYTHQKFFKRLDKDEIINI